MADLSTEDAAHLYRVSQAKRIIENLKVVDPDSGQVYPAYERVPGRPEDYRETAAHSNLKRPVKYCF